MAFKARAILEVVGYPEAHVNEVREKVLEKLAAEQGIKVIDKHIDNASQLEDSKMFGSFVDLELEVKDVIHLYKFCMEYLPSSIEIVDESGLPFDLTEFTHSLNDLLKRLHDLNIVISNLLRENKGLKKQLEG